ncbi:hypothetical protein BH10PSE18_BH10PSE18_21280 [soil metagenome]
MTQSIEMIVGLTAGYQTTEDLVHGTDSFTIVDGVGQLVANVTQLVSMARPMVLSTSSFALTTSFLKINADVQNGRSINPGDVYNLVGNAAGIIATIAFFAGGPVTFGVATAVGISAGVAGILSNQTLRDNLTNIVQGIINQTFPSPPVVPTPGLYIAPGGGLIARQDISASTPVRAIVCVEDGPGGTPIGCWESVEGSPESADPHRPPCEDPDGDGLSCTDW